MTRERGPVQPLEERCVKPGHWVIEGYDVFRIRGTGDRRWQIEGPAPRVGRRTLDEIRDWIRDHR
jgi:hypothetical protein